MMRDIINSFTLSMEPGHEELWLALRACPKALTADDLARAAKASEAKVEAYLSFLVRNGTAQVAGRTTEGRLLYSVQRLASAPCVFGETGRPSREFEIRRALWTACRMNKQAISVSGLFRIVREHHYVTKGTVERFITRLAAAGYLAPLEGASKDGEAEFMLRRAMDTGPLPPRLCEAELVYDVNRRAFYGHGIAHEVSLLEAA